jgi:glycosyltransferase involved in cell wall biosynthesis
MTEPAILERSSGGEMRTRTIRVAHVGALAGSSASGVDRTIAGLVAHLDRYGVQPEVWELSPRYQGISDRKEGSVRVVHLPAFGRAKSAISGLPAVTRRFIHERRAEIDLLHLHSVFIPDNVWVAKAAAIPYVLTPNGGYSPEVLRGRNRLVKTAWMWARERGHVRGATLVHAVAPRELDQLRSTFRVDGIQCIPNAIDLPAEPGAPEGRMRSDRRWIVFLGRLAIEHKGLDTLFEGFASYLKQGRNADTTELIIAGPDVRSGRARLQAMAASLLPEGTVRFVGPRFEQEKEELLRGAAVFVHTSRWEGMPFAVLEALATGCPVLLTRTTNLGELVEDYGAGAVVEGTAEAVGRGLKDVLDSPDDRYIAMCSSARTLATERFSWPAVAGQIAAAYRRIVG